MQVNLFPLVGRASLLTRMHRTFSFDDASVGRACRMRPSDKVALNPDFVGPQGVAIARGSAIDPG